MLKTKALLGVLSIGLAAGCLAGCASREIRCRFTRVDAAHKPIPPHDEWVKGMDRCEMEIHTLLMINAPPTVGVEVKGTKQQRTVLYEKVMKPPKHEQDAPGLKVMARWRY